MNTSDAKINNELTEDYRRLTQKYKDLQAKFRHFEVADTQKFDEVWAMHEDEAKDLVDKLLKADKVLSEQQLGWVWKAPDMLSLTATKGAITANVETPAGEDGGEAAPRPAVAAPVISGSRIRSVLKLLATEAGFLALQPQLQQSIDEMPEQDATLSRAEAMLKALGVKTEAKVAQLLQYFFKDFDQGCLVEIEAQGEQKLEYDIYGNVIIRPPDEDEALAEEEELLLRFPNEDIDELREMISPESVMAAIRAFMDDTAEGDATTNLAGASAVKTGSEDSTSGRRRGNNIQNYWVQLSQVVSDPSVDVWKQLETDLKNYKEILTKREQSIAEVDALAAQNVELKRVLNQYLGDTTNEKFCIPPSQTMRVNQNVKPKGGKVLMSKTG